MNLADPEVWVGAGFGLCFLVLIWPHPKALVAAALLSILFVRTASHFLGGALDAVDDAFVVIVFVKALEITAMSRRPMRRVPGMKLFATFALLGILSGVIQNVPVNTTLSGAFLAVKGLVFGFSVAQMNWNRSDFRTIFRWSAVVAAFIIASGIANLLAPSAWASVFSVNGGVIYRYGLPSMSGVFIHPFDFAAAMSIFALAAIAYTKYFKSDLRVRTLIAASCLATLSSLRRKDIIGLILGSILLSVQGRRWGTILSMLLVVPVIGVVGYGAISTEVGAFAESYLTAESAEARTVLTLGAFETAARFAPLGAGFGRYGSRTAAVEYSPVYFDLNFPSVYGLGLGENGAFLTDTAWPAIIGETGILGAACFVAGLLAILRFFVRIRRVDGSPELNWLGATGIAWLTLTIVQSTGAAVFTSPPMFPFLFGLLGLAVSVKVSEQRSTLSEKTSVAVRKDGR
jgi:hypothetical protein